MRLEVLRRDGRDDTIFFEELQGCFEIEGMVWSDSVAVEATLIGFLEALSMQPDVASLPDSPLACFIAYLASCTEGDLIDLTEAIVNRFNPQMPELTLIKKNIHPHVETLHGSIKQILSM